MNGSAGERVNGCAARGASGHTGYDKLWIAHADRTRVVSDAHRKMAYSVNGVVPGAFLVDGLVAGFWKMRRDGTSAVVDLQPFSPLPAADRDAVADEAVRMIAFAAPHAQDRDARLVAKMGR